MRRATARAILATFAVVVAAGFVYCWIIEPQAMAVFSLIVVFPMLLWWALENYDY